MSDRLNGEGDTLSRIWAKSPPHPGAPGEELTVHSGTAENTGVTLRHRIGRLPVGPPWFWEAHQPACLGHDAGKVADGFQEMVHNGLPWPQRHEVLSLGFLPYLNIHGEQALWVAAGIVTHHRPLATGRSAILTHYPETSAAAFAAHFATNPGAAAGFAAWLARRTGATTSTVATPDALGARIHEWIATLDEQFGEFATPTDPATGLALVLFHGAVVLADHVASAHGHLHTTPPVVGYRQRFDAWLHQNMYSMYPHQHAAAEARGHLLLRGCTGSGKTEAVALWAEPAADDIAHGCGGVPRLIWTLPYLAASNAMCDRLNDDLSVPVGILHSKAAAYHRAHHDQDTPAEESARRAVEAIEATRLYQETARVTTPWQLLHGFLGGPRHSPTLLESANAILVFDELHAYEPQRLGMLLAAMRQWEQLGSRIGILSATLPQRLATLLDETLAIPLHRVNGQPPHTAARHRIRTRDDHLTSAASIDAIRHDLAAGRSVLAVANTTSDALALFQQLAPFAREHHGDHGALLLHSLFRRDHRAEIEKKLLRRYRARGPRHPGLVVTTQVIEVSLDLDFDILHTAAATLEALLQRFGRVNRLGTRPAADVIIHRPHWTRRNHATWADHIYPAPPVATAWGILTRHNNHDINENDNQDWIDEVYSTAWGDEWERVVRTARDRFRRDFLDFTDPFADRTDLETLFQDMFDGVETVYTGHLKHYRAALTSADDVKIGRVLAADYLIPLNATHRHDAKWNPQLNIYTIDGHYDPHTGLTDIRTPRR